MLSAADKKKIAALLKIKEADFEKALTDEAEVAIPIPEIEVFTKEELQTRDGNILEEGKKQGKTDGETSAIELFTKELGKKLNVEFKGQRVGEIAKALQEEMNKGNDTKITTLQQQVELLTKDKEALEAEKLKIEQEKTSIKTDYEIISEFPKRKPTMTEQEYLAALKMNLQFKEDGVYKNGELMRDTKNQSPLQRKQALETYFKERGWTEETETPTGGRGGGDNNPGAGQAGVKTMSQAKEAWRALNPEKNTNHISPEFQKYVEPYMKDPQFNPYE